MHINSHRVVNRLIRECVDAFDKRLRDEIPDLFEDMRCSHPTLRHHAVKHPKHAPHGIVGAQHEIGTLAHAEVQAVMIQVARLPVDEQAARQVKHIGTHAIGVALDSPEAIDVRDEPPNARKVMDTM